MDAPRLPPRPVPAPLAAEGWWARWPEDAEALAAALAVLAAFRDDVETLAIDVAGDLGVAGGDVLGRLDEAGVGDDDLPDVELRPGPAGDAALHVGQLPAALALAGEYGRYPSRPSDEGAEAVWEAARDTALPGEPVTVISDIAPLSSGGTSDGIAVIAAEIAALAPLTVVSASGAVRRAARRIPGGRAIPRPASAAELPGSGVAVVDGRRPEDLRLAAGADRVAIAHDARLSTLARAALALPALSRA